MTFTHILAAIDFSEGSDAALACARMIAERFGARLHLLHVIEDPGVAAAGPDGYVVDVHTLREALQADAEQKLADLLAAHPGVPVTAEVVFGRPAATIARVAADRGTDLVVVGTHGRSGFSRLMLGSVAERVLRLAPCPVLTVRGVPADAAREQPAVATAKAPEGGDALTSVRGAPSRACAGSRRITAGSSGRCPAR